MPKIEVYSYIFQIYKKVVVSLARGGGHQIGSYSFYSKGIAAATKV